MSDGRVVIDTSLDTSGVEKGTEKVKKSLNETEKQFSNSTKESVKFEKEMEKLKDVLGTEVPEATREAYSNISKMNQEIRSASREFGSHSQEAIKAKNALNEYVLGLDDTSFKQIYMRSQLGLTDAQLNQQANSIKLNARMVSLMGSQTEILTKRMQGLKENGVKPSDLLPASTIGQFKMLNETIAASGNPIYKLSAGYRALGTSMESTIKGWSAQKIAVKMAGEDMVKYGLILRGITAGQASLAMAFPIVGIAAVLAYGAIFSSAIQANEGLQKLAETAKSKLGEAFKPLLDVAGVVVKAFLDMTIKVADLMIKFNEAHPIISKVVAAIALLTPAMTLLLLPLNMGIGLFPGLAVAINGAWVAISGVAGAVGLASSTFLVFAAVIGTIVGALIYFWQTNEGFKNAVITAWSAISQKAIEVFGGLKQIFSTLAQAFNEGGLQGLLTAGSQIIMNLVQGMATALPQMVAKMNEVRMTILSTIASNLPQILETGVQIITMLVQGFAQTLPLVIDIVIQVMTTVIDTIVKLLPTILDAGIKVLVALIEGITNAIPKLVDMIPKIIETIVKVITENLPQIIESGTQILISVIDGIVQALPELIEAVPQIITSIITTIIENLPQIIESGIKIIIALISGLIQAIPQLVGAIPQIISAIREAFTSVDWGTIGSNIMSGIGAGIKSAVGSVISSAKDAAISIKDSIKDALDIHSPSRILRDEVGKNMMKGVGVGIKVETPNVEKIADEQIASLTARLQSSVDYETTRNNSRIATQSAYDTSKGNTQSIVNNDNGVTQNVTIVNPERTPSENARALKKVGRDLAFGY